MTNTETSVSACETPKTWTRKEIVLALLILFLGLVVRFYCYYDRSWDPDQPLHYMRAAELARGERWDHLIGYPTRAGGAHLPALYHQILAIPCFFGGPMVAAAFLTLLQFSIVPLLLFVGRRFVGARASFLAASLFAFSPSIVSRSQTFANELVALPFACLFLFAMLSASRNRKSSAAGWGFAAACVFGQVHLSGLFTLSLVGPLCLFYMYKAGLHRSLPGLLVGLCVLAPFFFHETKSQFRETRRLTGLTKIEQNSAELARKKASRIQMTYQLPLETSHWFGNDLTEKFVGGKLAKEARDDMPWLSALNTGVNPFFSVILVLSIGLVLASKNSVHRCLCFVLGAHWFVYWLVGIEVDTNYLTLITPHCCLVMGIAVVKMEDKVSTYMPKARAQTLVTALFTFILALWFTSSIHMANVVSRNGGDPKSDYGPSYNCYRKVSNWVLTNRREVRHFDRMIYLFSIDISYRSLPDQEKSQFDEVEQVVPFWNLTYIYPKPKNSAGAVSIVENEVPKGREVLARFSNVYILEAGRD